MTRGYCRLYICPAIHRLRPETGKLSTFKNRCPRNHCREILPVINIFSTRYRQPGRLPASGPEASPHRSVDSPRRCSLPADFRHDRDGSGAFPTRLRAVSGTVPSLSKIAGQPPGSLPLSKTAGESPDPSPLSKTVGLLPGSRSSSRKPTGSLRGRSLSLENCRATSGFTSSLENRRAVSKTFSRANPVPNRIRVLPGRLQTPSKHFP